MEFTTHVIKEESGNNVLNKQIKTMHCMNKTHNNNTWPISQMTLFVMFRILNVFQFRKMLSLEKRVEYLE